MASKDAFRLYIEIPLLDQTRRFIGRYEDVIKGRCRGKDTKSYQTDVAHEGSGEFGDSPWQICRTV